MSDLVKATAGRDGDPGAIVAAVGALPDWAIQDIEFRRYIHFGVAILRFLGQDRPNDPAFYRVCKAVRRLGVCTCL